MGQGWAGHAIMSLVNGPGPVGPQIRDQRFLKNLAHNCWSAAARGLTTTATVLSTRAGCDRHVRERERRSCYPRSDKRMLRPLSRGRRYI